ncbi:formyltransferase family protein [Chitinophaga deserti]|uniref:formyltransferase family protein n=1 Tax=Chitinophaga deserti TaxID=2164099 RepID=UPI000D6C14D7|nr:formyltransferase family protein [Chitinophaga deserti]
MRIFLVIDETNFYQPDFVAALLRNRQYEYVGAALVTDIPRQSSLNTYLKKNYRFLLPSEMARLAWKQARFSWLDWFGRKSEGGPFYSVKSVLRHFGIEYFEPGQNINLPQHTDRIRKLRPDVILSSNSLIFRKAMLESAPCCINRHSALLPSYGGLWPVFQALRNKEASVGVTVHEMTERIDKGRILGRVEIPVEPHDTVDSLYIKCFKYSAEACFMALENIRNGVKPLPDVHPPSYFSFPDRGHWEEFRQQNRKFI